MSKKSSVYFAEPLLALTGNLGEGDSCSGRINRTAERYLEIVKRHDLGLTDAERLILGNCLSGSWVDPIVIRHLADEVADSEFADTKEAKALIKKLQAANFADLVAEVERLGF